MRGFLFFFLAGLLSACDGVLSPEENSRQLTAPALVGEWKNVYMNIRMNTYKGGNSSRHLNVREDNWEKTMNIHPIHTFFRADGTYNSPHVNLQDSVFYDPAGRWTLRNDSIIMKDTFPEKGPQYRYQLRLNGDTLEFRGVEDMDGDGGVDDEYFGKQKRVG